MGFNARGKTLELFDRGIIKSPQPNGKDKRNRVEIDCRTKKERKIDRKTKRERERQRNIAGYFREHRERVIFETNRY